MIYYPITTLILAGVTEFRFVVNQEHLDSFQRLLGDGRHWGLSFSYSVQNSPDGLAGAFLKAEDHVKGSPSAVILGDNLFYGAGSGTALSEITIENKGALLFCKSVENPEEFGVVELSSESEVLSLEEKPVRPKSSIVATGLYFYDETAIDRARDLTPSVRGELEITDLNLSYLRDDSLNARLLPRSNVWLDTGTVEGLSQASEFVRVVEERQGHKVGSPEEAAWRLGHIDSEQVLKLAGDLSATSYGRYLKSLINK